MELDGYLRSSPRLDATFAALADPTRRAILARLAKGDASVNGFGKAIHHEPTRDFEALESSGTGGTDFARPDAQRRPRRLEARPLREATQWLEQYRHFWEAQFQRLDASSA